MPLPDADNPKWSNLYSQLRTSQLASVTQDNFDKVKDPVFINDAFEDEARRLKLWGEIAGKLSSSGALPGTGEILRVLRTSAGTNTVFAPGEGEAWVIDGAQSGTFYTGQSSVTLSLYDASNGYYVAVGQQDAASTAFTESYMSSPVHIVYPMALRVTFAGTASGGNGIVQVAIHRVR